MNANETLPATMLAVGRRRYGGPDAIAVVERPVPAPGAGEVLVRVATSSGNAADAFLLRGEPRLIRLSSGLARPSSPVLGRDVAGTVAAVGEGVEGVAPGDRVHGETDGAWSEFAVLPASVVARVPRGIDLVQAAALPLPGVTALQALRLGVSGRRDAAGEASASGGASDVPEVSAGSEASAGPDASAAPDPFDALAGRRVLVTGASGNVGLLAVSIAAAYGADVTAAASRDRLDLVRAAGAAGVVERTHPAADWGRGYDLVVDLTAQRPVADLVARLAPRGSLVMSTGAGGRTLGPLPRLASTALRDLGTRRHLRVLAAKADGDDLRALDRLVRSGRVVPVIDGVVPMADAADAVRRFEAGASRGRIVLDATRLG
ncbi:zinc-binding alcohol dehydrogenase family protein [Agromyces sp. MMS24-K17]|uniref:quinone oxidoreductase family protein n=1 Tax=Agromyces sp. MMS24-K17 TaxID=3372850 RepID=UPI003754D159